MTKKKDPKDLTFMITDLLLKNVNELKPYKNNARTHSKEQIKKIADSIQKFGFTNPILIDGEDNIIAGHGRLLAAKQLSIDAVPTVNLSHLTKDEARAYVIADNRLALDAGWDNEMLKLELSELEELGFDLDVIGFSAAELDAILNDSIVEDGLIGDDDVPENAETRCKLGDVWLLGEHRLMCGNATSVDDIDKLLDSNSVDMVYTDPPYGCNAVGNDGTIGSSSNKYDKIIGDENNQTAIDSYNICAAMKVNSMVFWGANFFASAMPDSSNWIVWNKDNGTNDFGDCELAWTNKKGAIRMFTHKWNGFLKDSEKGQKRVHPTQKPIELALWCFKEYGKDTKNILDLFGGSGSTLIACEKSKRKCSIMELDPKYCDVILKRWEDFTGNKATLEVSYD